MVSFGALLPLAALQKATATPHPPHCLSRLCLVVIQWNRADWMLLWLETFASLKLHFLECRRKHTFVEAHQSSKRNCPLLYPICGPPAECVLPSAAWSSPSGHTASIPIPDLPQQTCALILNYLTTCKSAFLTLRSPSVQPLSPHPSMKIPLTSPSHCPIFCPDGLPMVPHEVIFYTTDVSFSLVPP